MRQRLRRDPLLRFTELGRTLRRWIFSRAIRSDERLDVAGKVPSHCTYIVANLARHCAEELAATRERVELIMLCLT